MAGPKQPTRTVGGTTPGTDGQRNDADDARGATDDAGVQVRINPKLWRTDVVEIDGVQYTHEPTPVSEQQATKLAKHKTPFTTNDGRETEVQLLVRAGASDEDEEE